MAGGRDEVSRDVFVVRVFLVDAGGVSSRESGSEPGVHADELAVDHLAAEGQVVLTGVVDVDAAERIDQMHEPRHNRHVGAEERAVWRAAREYRSRLKAQLDVDPLDMAVRAELAASYRADDHLDQAGRWGLLVADGNTDLERRLFARTVVRTGESTIGRVRRLILLPEELLSAGEAPLLSFEQLLIEEQDLFDREREPEPPRPRDGLVAQLESARGVMVVGIGLVAALFSFLAVVNAFLGMPDARLITRVGFVVMMIPVAGWAAASVVIDVSHRRWFGAAVKTAVLASAAAVVVWLAPSDGAYFPWEK